MVNMLKLLIMEDGLLKRFILSNNRLREADESLFFFFLKKFIEKRDHVRHLEIKNNKPPLPADLIAALKSVWGYRGLVIE